MAFRGSGGRGRRERWGGGGGTAGTRVAGWESRRQSLCTLTLIRELSEVTSPGVVDPSDSLCSSGDRVMEEMDNKPYQPLSKGRHEMEMSYTSSSDESEDGRAAHQRSYASRETLPDYAHELRLTLGSAHRERQAGYSQHPPAGYQQNAPARQP
ncbi:hypothetical protein CRUP_014364 [Coryphaenoides rupestris]|nr:hypothetical protein CRUP_014364 [Coryphaenoides rupestris]